MNMYNHTGYFVLERFNQHSTIFELPRCEGRFISLTQRHNFDLWVMGNTLDRKLNENCARNDDAES